MILLALVLIIAMSTALFWPGNRARRTTERTRLLLRQQGFKTDLADFDSSIPETIRARLDVFNRAGRALADAFPSRSFDLMTPVATNAAVVMALDARSLREGEGSLWESLRGVLDAQHD